MTDSTLPLMPVDNECFDSELSTHVWRQKYRYSASAAGVAEASVQTTWRRVSRAVASVESTRRAHWEKRFLESLDGFRFLPAGRILAAAGTDYDATLFNCFVMGPFEDSIDGIFERLRESALTMQRGGGIGCDFSTLRPAGSRAVASGRTASGPVSFMHLWNSMCATLLSTGSRRGAMMGVLRCDHPDIVEFVEAKRDRGALTNFNLSVQVTDEFMHAVANDEDWELTFPTASDGARAVQQNLLLPGHNEAVTRAVHERISAAQLWQRIIDNAYDTAEPGVLFVDRINALNNLYYCEHITATNPCGEVPLPAWGACDLGSINLAAHVVNPFMPNAKLDLDGISRLARDATRFLDDVIDLSAFPLPAQASEARKTRRVGLGMTGLADALIMLGYRYDSEAGREVARFVLTRIRDAAYEASIQLAREKGPFPCFDKDAFLAGAYARSLPDPIRDRIAKHGLRNSHLLAIAPAGSISILANNVSSGIEPVFAPEMARNVRSPDQTMTSHLIRDHAYSVWLQSSYRNAALPDAFVTAREIAPQDHLLMVAALQPIVDNAVSKTVNVPESITREDFRGIYREAFDLGLKGCTVFRPNSSRGEVLADLPTGDTVHCCVPEREGD